MGVPVFFAIGSFFSYAATVFLFLPCLFLVSRFARLNAALTCLLGAALGGASNIPLAWISWRSSGPDSGPPQGLFADYLWRDLFEPTTLAFPLGGLITAALYWVLVNQRSRGKDSSNA